MNLWVKNKSDLMARLLSRCEELDFKRLAGDVEPFINKKQDVDRVLLFETYIKTALTG